MTKKLECTCGLREEVDATKIPLPGLIFQLNDGTIVPLGSKLAGYETQGKDGLFFYTAKVEGIVAEAIKNHHLRGVESEARSTVGELFNRLGVNEMAINEVTSHTVTIQ